jgi:hypothetical protein
MNSNNFFKTGTFKFFLEENAPGINLTQILDNKENFQS